MFLKINCLGNKKLKLKLKTENVKFVFKFLAENQLFLLIFLILLKDRSPTLNEIKNLFCLLYSL